MSGGGGWGSKQGLLSLDPQTALATDEDQDMQRFIDSFAEGEASPEKFVQFFVEPSHAPGQAVHYQPKVSAQRVDTANTTWVIGTADSGTRPSSKTASTSTSDTAVETFEDLFGAASEAGLFLKWDPNQASQQHEGAIKVDVPRSHFVSLPSGNPDADLVIPSESDIVRRLPW